MARRALPKIDDLSLGELDKLIERASELKDAKRQEARAEFFERMKTEAAAVGLSLNEVMGRGPAERRQRSDKGVKLKPKFVGPKGETYTGRGPTPGWLRALEAKGHKRERYLA